MLPLVLGVGLNEGKNY
uniref:Uncharacterized protein n=1 Tax=Rhizophora mucronata TaxID=61149 RepID=A0A2P2MEU9_RHIMU